VGEIGTGNLDNTSVFYVVIPENCTFENFQHNVALILGVQSGVVVIEAWGHDDVAWKKKQQKKKNVMNKNGIDDDDDDEEEDIEKDIMMNIQNESLKIPTKLRFEPSDCVVNFLRSKMSAPSGAYAEWSDEKSVLPTLAVTLRRVEMSRAKFWLTHPHDLARVFEMISSSRNVRFFFFSMLECFSLCLSFPFVTLCNTHTHTHTRVRAIIRLDSVDSLDTQTFT
jgi:hypothetical protein